MLGNTLILDLADERGSFCSKLLADLGAEVVKVEPPHGNPERETGPFHGSQSLSFIYKNTGKHGIVLDLESPEGNREFQRLVRKADILIDAGQVSARDTTANPRLVHVSVAVRQDPYTASLYGAITALLNLKKREITEKGCHVNLAVNTSVPVRLPGDDRNNLFFHTLPCKDGLVRITILRNWETLREIMASEHMSEGLADERWSKEAYRISNIEHLAGIVAEWTRRHTREELFRLGQAMRFPWAPVETPEEVLDSPQLRARRFFIPITIPGLDSTVPFPGVPYKFSSCTPGEDPQNCLRYLDVAPEIHTEGSRMGNEETLGGLRVIDLTRMLSGPYATRILADFGAEVIKIQSRITAQGAERNDTPSFRYWNRNKRSLSLNLNQPDARNLFLELVAVSDVVVENFSPRVMANWGLDYSTLQRVKPDIIMASISAMGQTGPWKEFVGFADTFHALSGLLSILSTSSKAPAGLRFPYGDIVTALYTTLAVLAAVLNRDRTGQGRHIDISAYEAVCTLIGPALAASAAGAQAGGQFPELDSLDWTSLWPWTKKPAGWKSAPALGQDNHYAVVELLGHSEAEYESLTARRIL